MIDILKKFGDQFCKSSVPDLKPGYLVEVHQKIKEGNKERVQVFKGTIMAVNSGHGVNDNFTIRKISEGIGVDRVFPIHSPTIVKISVIRAYKVRRAKLNYLRELSGKALRMKEVPLNLREKNFGVPSVSSSEISVPVAVEVPETVEKSE